MTKQRAYELAQQELPNCVYYEIKDRAMEIYAAAFSEWVNNNYWSVEINCITKWSNIFQRELSKEYTTAELLIEFEKL